MGLGNNNTGIYLSIADGKIVRRFKEPTADSVARQISKGPNTGKTVHEEHYNFVEGLITSITTKESEYGKSWVVLIHDGAETFTLQMDYSSGYSSAFLKCLPNCDFSRPVRISPKMTIDGDKKKTTMFLNQDGNPLKHAFTKDNPNGLPQMKKIKVKGKEQWDDSDMMQFFEEMVRTQITPQLKQTPVAVSEEDNSDLPF